MSTWLVIVLIVAGATLLVLLTAIYVRNKDLHKLEYMLDAFEDEEFNFRFTDKGRFNRALNRIKWIVEKRRQQNEQESWTRLIRVLTHEIMNTVSPIASLSDALSRQIGRDYNEETVKEGLQTISDSSNNLISFVQSYRELAGVAKPIKKALMVDELITGTISLTSQQCASCGATCLYIEKTSDILLYADESQISRRLINLIKNALQADATEIVITADIDSSKQTLISIKNNGMPISPDSQDQIFIPFFTTKANGSGIGLSLSRQIMRAHNGSLDLVCSDSEQTEFLLTFR